MAIGAILGGAQFALGASKALFGGPDPAIAQQAFQTAFQNSMIQYNNQKTEENYLAALAGAREQMGLNFEAATRAWSAEQIRLNEIYEKAAFQHEGMVKQLVEAQGYNNAREVYGKSARRANLVSTLGAYGRTNAQLAETLSSAREQSERQMETLQYDLESQQRQTWGKVSTPPQLQAQIPSFTPPASGGLATALKIGGAALQGLTTAYEFTAPGADFLGIGGLKKPIPKVQSVPG